MQATEAELVPELASASHGLQRINFSRSRIHFLPIDAWPFVGIKSFPRCRSSLVFANHTSIIQFFCTVSLAAVYTVLVDASYMIPLFAPNCHMDCTRVTVLPVEQLSQPFKQIKVQSDLPEEVAIFCLCITVTYD